MRTRGNPRGHVRATWAVGIAAVMLAGVATVGVASQSSVAAIRTAQAPSGLAAAVAAHMLEDATVSTAKTSPPVPPLAVRDSSPSAIGSWAAPIRDATGVVGINSILLDSGKVLIYGPVAENYKNGTYEIKTIAAVFDPTTGKSVRDDPPEDDDVFCGAATILGDGTVLVVGGLDPYHTWYGSKGTPVVLLFNPQTTKWTEAQPMHQARWYPTVTELADGSAVVVGGRDANGKPNHDIEHIGPLPSTTPQVVGQTTLDYQQDLYPNQFLLPNGDVFTFAGSATSYLDPTTWRIVKGPVPLAPEFSYPNAVALPITPGHDIQMVVYGGKNKFAGTTTAVSSRIDLSSSNPAFTALTPMPQPRTNMNSVMLPDGTILVVGGNLVDQFDDPYLQSLLYNPATDTWTPMASQTMRRAYHSTAILLPDGRVLSAGDNGPAKNNGGRNTEELYSPSYLFKGARPVITSAPTIARPGAQYLVVTTGPIAKTVLISPGATTHATNMHQRLVDLASVPAYGHGAAITIPNDGTVPPGPYMLFALDANNIPSVATWVMVQ